MYESDLTPTTAMGLEGRVSVYNVGLAHGSACTVSTATVVVVVSVVRVSVCVDVAVSVSVMATDVTEVYVDTTASTAVLLRISSTVLVFCLTMV